jgi:hypothetical protein
VQNYPWRIEACQSQKPINLKQNFTVYS